MGKSLLETSEKKRQFENGVGGQYANIAKCKKLKVRLE